MDEILASQNNQATKKLGLEAGSKAELLAVLAMAHKASSVIVCNGYKDKEYVRLELIGEKLGHQVHIVLEKMSELYMILTEAKKLGVNPRLGSQGKGKWQASGGEKSKFGLSASQVLEVVKVLTETNMLDALKLVHFHLGSQMATIRDVRLGVSEAARFYCELRKLGAGIICMDVGGGLASDKVFKILRALVGISLVGMDVVEVATAYDSAEITSLAAATVGVELLHLCFKMLTNYLLNSAFVNFHKKVNQYATFYL